MAPAFFAALLLKALRPVRLLLLLSFKFKAPAHTPVLLLNTQSAASRVVLSQRATVAPSSETLSRNVTPLR
jgi:hypothetical protein